MAAENTTSSHSIQRAPAMRLLFLCLLAAIPGLVLGDCVGDDRERLLSLELAEFDQDMNGGWRRIASMPYCRLDAADLIAEYRSRREGRGIALIFHEGQLRAKAGQTGRAIALFDNARTSSETDFAGWNHYVDATIAFLEQDKESLLKARDALAGIEAPSDFRAVDADGNEIDMAWPPNLHVVEGLLRCLGRSYSEAYGCPE